VKIPNIISWLSLKRGLVKTYIILLKILDRRQIINDAILVERYSDQKKCVVQS
jgi:hypothetical protein